MACETLEQPSLPLGHTAVIASEALVMDGKRLGFGAYDQASAATR